MTLDAFRADARAWLTANRPRRDLDAAVHTNRETTPAAVAADRAAQRQLFDAGYAGITIPTEYGGRGLSDEHRRIWIEEAAGFVLPAAGGVAYGTTWGIVLPTLLAHASEEQKRDWIPRILSGEDIWVQMLSEPGAGSDLAGVLTRATRDGDQWILSGTKMWSSGAMIADWGMCLARTDWDAPKHRGLTWFKVPLRHPQVTVRPIREINGSAEFCEEFLDDVALGDDMVIGPVNGGWTVAATLLVFERGAGAALGSGQGSPASRRSQARRLAPDLVDLAEAAGCVDDPGIRDLIVRCHINDFMQRELTIRVNQLMATGETEATVASMIKLSSGTIEPLRAAAAMDIAGRSGAAWAPGDELHRLANVAFLNGRIMSIAGGSNEIQRNIISERILGLPREPSVDTDRPFREVLRHASEWGRRPSR
jgi:alkylation response protein AidB-like acyl-CoA dehydrogenase